MRWKSLGVALAMVLAACPPAESTDTAADEQAIRSRVEALNAAVTAQNDSLAASVYAVDAVVMPPGRARVTGRAAIQAFWAEDWPLKGQVTMTPATIRVSGEWAIEEGNWTWTQPTTAGISQDAGKYLQTWQRIDGEWFIVQDIWNSDGRAAAGSSS